MSLVEDPGGEMWHGWDLGTLDVDQAFLQVVNRMNRTLWLYHLSQDCYKCPFQRLDTDQMAQPVLPSENYSLAVSTLRDGTFRLRSEGSLRLAPANGDDFSVCQVPAPLGEFGVYRLEALDKESCRLSTLKDPVNIYYAFLVCFLAYAGVCLAWQVGKRIPGLWLRWRGRDGGIDLAMSEGGGGPQATSEDSPKKKQRLKSLDTFRGMSIIIMIFVNDGAGGFWFLDHSTWDGLQVADLVFPWFMWIMGVCIPISMRSLLNKGLPRLRIMRKIFKRSLILFIFGLCLNSIDHLSLENLRIMGVLQRFAITYFVLATIAMFLQRTNVPTPQNKVAAAFLDVWVLWPQWAIVLTLTLLYCLLVFLLPVPGCPTGYLGPGGLHDNASHWNCTGGATGYVDRLILGRAHLYQNPTTKPVYETGPYDPEGLVGCLPSILQVMLGVQAGTILLHFPAWKSRVVRWVCWGVVCGAVGAALCSASQHEGVVPLSKNMWSLSFVMVTTCFAFLLLALFYLLLDVLHWWGGAPFFYPGMNSILLYMGHEILYAIMPFHWTIGAMRSHCIKLAESLWVAFLWVLASIFFFKRGIFLKV